jgi:hypothetical protein
MSIFRSPRDNPQGNKFSHDVILIDEIKRLEKQANEGDDDALQRLSPSSLFDLAKSSFSRVPHYTACLVLQNNTNQFYGRFSLLYRSFAKLTLR